MDSSNPRVNTWNDRERMGGFVKQCNLMPQAEDEDSLNHFAKVIFCLGQINLTVLDQVSNNMQRYLLIFAKGPQDLQNHLWCHCGWRISSAVHVFQTQGS